MESILFWVKKKELPSRVKSILPTITLGTCLSQARRLPHHLSEQGVPQSQLDPSTRRYIRRRFSRKDSPLAFPANNWKNCCTVLVATRIQVSIEELWASLQASNKLTTCSQTIQDKRVINTSTRRSIEISKATTLWLAPPLTTSMIWIRWEISMSSAMVSTISSKRLRRSVLPRVRPLIKQLLATQLQAKKDQVLEEVMAQPTLSAEPEAILIRNQLRQPLEKDQAHKREIWG